MFGLLSDRLILSYFQSVEGEHHEKAVELLKQAQGRLIQKHQSRTNGPINAHLTFAQVISKYNHNNEKQEALL